MSTNTENAEIVEDISIDGQITKEGMNSRVKEIPYLFIKRLVDIIGSLVGLIIVVPLTIIIGIARVALKENDGPIFYEHLRYGKNGKQFRMYKPIY